MDLVKTVTDSQRRPPHPLEQEDFLALVCEKLAVRELQQLAQVSKTARKVVKREWQVRTGQLSFQETIIAIRKNLSKQEKLGRKIRRKRCCIGSYAICSTIFYAAGIALFIALIFRKFLLNSVLIPAIVCIGIGVIGTVIAHLKKRTYLPPVQQKKKRIEIELEDLNQKTHRQELS